MSAPPKRRVIHLKPLEEETQVYVRGASRNANGVLRTAIVARQVTKPVAIARPVFERQDRPLLASPVTLATSATPCQTEDDNALGSWTHRKTMHDVFGDKSDTSLMTAKPAARNAKPGQNLQRASLMAESASSSDDNAWRQRFALKWHREQARPCKVCDDDMCDDPWHAALHMLQAANAHPYLQTPLPDHDCYPAGASSAPPLTLDEDAEGLEAESDTDKGASTASKLLVAQHALSEAAFRARQLFKHQVTHLHTILKRVSFASSNLCLSLYDLPEGDLPTGLILILRN